MRIGVTGARGFVGKALMARLRQLDVAAVPIVRNPSGLAGECVVGDLASVNAGDLPAMDVMVHVAALAHTPIADAAEAEARFNRANVVATERVIHAAINAGVKHVLFISSVKVNGEQTSPGAPFTESDTPRPEDAYGRSKWRAEQRVRAMCSDAGIRFNIVRPPLVYGRDVSANFRKLAKLACSPVPLPLGGIRNARSLVYVGNLVDALSKLAIDERSVNETYMISDGQDISTSDLLRMLAEAQGRSLHLLPSAPIRLLTKNRHLMGFHQRLFLSLQVDSSKLRTQFGWVAPFSMDAALVESFR
jgi:nucleoside-diphosphate-sugar epimerase